MTKHSRSFVTPSLLATVLFLPAVAHADPLTPLGIFAEAAPLMKLIMLGLVGATLAAVVVCGIKLASGPRLTGGSAFLSGLRLGGPLAGFLGAAYASLNIFVAIANIPEPVSLKVAAPGIAEALFLLGLGLLTGAVAVIANWAVEARIDRAVLKA
ncbi:MAG: MotA/TolQ/ExbB proton channel family protein [Caulobacter sp.]|nr:MotA/TolQ/ExbB proton channel family protein [Caulobacter sp.]